MKGSERHKQILEEYEDGLMRLVMEEVAAHEGQRFLDESNEVRESGEFQSSEEETRRFTRRLDAELKKYRAASWRQQVFKGLKTAAVVVLVTAAVFFIAMTTV